MTDQALLSKLCEGILPEITVIKKIGGGGSSRRYYRLFSADSTVIGVVGDDIEENKTFIRLSDYLNRKDIQVPRMLKVSKDHNAYLLNDLGDTQLLSLLGGPKGLNLAKNALDDLIRIQTLPKSEWIYKVGFAPFSERLVKWDLNYFKYDFLKPASVEFDEEKLENDFEKLTERLAAKDFVTGFMYRDFQSRNIMVHNNALWFIDFQGARLGPLTYDAVSFIWQAKAPFSFEDRETLAYYYCQALSLKSNQDIDKLVREFEIMQVFRTLQVLGAYGFRGLIEKKSHFVESIPLAIINLNYLSKKGLLKDYPEIEKISEGLTVSKKFKILSKEEKGELTVSVYSFSYKKGYPEDLTGNGGGFMFDCRAIHNPGRYQEYKELTGMDESVIEFLEKTDEASLFINNSIELVKPSIERYLKRGFTSLQVGFGCTGGQHRSVYCAEKFSKLIRALYPDVKIKIVHREQNIERELK